MTCIYSFTLTNLHKVSRVLVGADAADVFVCKQVDVYNPVSLDIMFLFPAKRLTLAARFSSACHAAGFVVF